MCKSVAIRVRGQHGSRALSMLLLLSAPEMTEGPTSLLSILRKRMKTRPLLLTVSCSFRSSDFPPKAPPFNSFINTGVFHL